MNGTRFNNNQFSHLGKDFPGYKPTSAHNRLSSKRTRPSGLSKMGNASEMPLYTESDKTKKRGGR